MPKKASPGHFSVLYFASAASFTRKSSEEVPAPLTVADLYNHLEGKYTGIGEKVLTSSLLTINLQYVDTEEDGPGTPSKMINEGDEVAIIPPCHPREYRMQEGGGSPGLCQEYGPKLGERGFLKGLLWKDRGVGCSIVPDEQYTIKGDEWILGS